MLKRLLGTGILVGLVVAAGGHLASCDQAYYRTMEAMGKHKRQLLVERVEAARDGQLEAKQQFRDALERFTAVVEFDGGDLEGRYNALRAELDASEAKAEAVRNRIDAVEEVADALFEEWEAELEAYTDEDLRLSSEIKMHDTRKRYAQLLRSMKRAEGKMDPVLAAFRDQVLYLKHNLNARAVASLEQTAVSLKQDVAGLIADMEASIAEANAFIEAMGLAPEEAD